MDVVRDLAKALRELDRVAGRYDDEELSSAVRKVMEELGVLIDAFGRIAAIHEELEMVIKGTLRLDSTALLEVELKDGEEVSSFIERCREVGADHNKTLAYLLGTGKARLDVEGGKVVVRLDGRRN
ncbi:MAG: hypothetical protein QXP98_06785 [Thermoproteus sp.]